MLWVSLCTDSCRGEACFILGAGVNLDGDILLLMSLMAAVLESIVIKQELSFFLSCTLDTKRDDHHVTVCRSEGAVFLWLGRAQRWDYFSGVAQIRLFCSGHGEGKAGECVTPPLPHSVSMCRLPKQFHLLFLKSTTWRTLFCKDTRHSFCK